MAGEDAEVGGGGGGSGEIGGRKTGEEMVLPPYFYDVPEMEEREWKAWIVPLIVVANVAVFIAEMFVNNCPVSGGGAGAGDGSGGRGSCLMGFLGRLSYQPIRDNPLLGPSSKTLEKLGALQWERIVHEHQWWRLLASIWLHAGLIHLLVDILCLIFIGVRLEQQFGFVRIGTIYLISGIGGNVISSIFITKGISVGSSGALFGLLGAMVSELITNWSIYSNRAAAISTLLLIIVINLVIGILPLVNNIAHIGGFIAGFLLGFVLLIRPQFGWIERQSLPHCSKYKLYQLVLRVMALIFLLIGFVVSLVMLFRGVNGSEGCQWCRYMNCVPTSKWTCEN